MLYECKGWDRGFWDPKHEYGVNDHPKYDKFNLRHRLLFDHEVFEKHDLFLRQQGQDLRADAISNLGYDLDICKMVLRTRWDDVYHFIRLNPMAATFEWSELVEKAIVDENNGLDYTTSVHIWKAMAHTRWRREIRHKYILTKETLVKNKHMAEERRRKESDIQPLSWQKDFPTPDELERKFVAWYCRQAVIMHKQVFGDWVFGPMSNNKEEEFAREFGWTCKDYTKAAREIANVSDDEEPPAREDEWGNQIDEVHR